MLSKEVEALLELPPEKVTPGAVVRLLDVATRLERKALWEH